jgi:hypothetical protein
MPAAGLLLFKPQVPQSVSASISGALPAGDLSLALEGRTWFLHQLDRLVVFGFVRFKSPHANEVWLTSFAGTSIRTMDLVLPHNSRGFGRIMQGLSRVSRLTVQISDLGFCPLLSSLVLGVVICYPFADKSFFIITIPSSTVRLVSYKQMLQQ